MADTPQTAPKPREPWLDSLLRKQRPASYALFALTAILAGAGILIGVKHGLNVWPLWSWCGAMAIFTLTGALWLMLFDAQVGNPRDAVRLFVLGLGTITGLLTVLLALVLGGILGLFKSSLSMWWPDIMTMMQPGGIDRELSSTDRFWSGVRATLPLPILIVGLAIMFVSLLLARTDERTSVVLRRLLYGYNVLLQSILVLFILVVMNVLVPLLTFGSVTALVLAVLGVFLLSAWGSETGSAFRSGASGMARLRGALPIVLIVGGIALATYSLLSPGGKKLNQPLDFTKSNIYTLAPRSEAILHSLQKPTKIYVVLSRELQGYEFSQMTTLLANCQAHTDQIDVEYVSPIPGVDPVKMDKLRKDFPTLEPGVLIVYGDQKEDMRLIKAEELMKREGDPRRQATQSFRGEDALMSELDLLVIGRKKSVVYFTQGNGELDLKDTATEDIDRGSGVLKRRLEKRNIEVKALNLTPTDAKVPDDAEVVVIAGPRSTLPAYSVKAIDEYMNTKKGRLVLMLDVTLNRNETGMKPSGLEDLLARANVQLPNERVMSGENPTGDPLMMFATVSRDIENTNPIGKAFKRKILQLYDARTVRVQPNRAPNGRYQAETLLVALPDVLPWVETDLAAPLSSIIREMQRNPEVARRKLAPGQRDPIPLAVAVSESGSMPSPHAGMMMPSGEQTPRMIVIGDSTLACNAIMSERGGNIDYDFLASSIGWLTGRETSIGIEPKANDTFQLSPDAEFWPFVLLPSFIIGLGVIGTGTGVWLVRRR
ncbi:MAG: GldG family protein [Gemmataceae bacterium]|nr:GldG family protein [Gemmataceae bacterium]